MSASQTSPTDRDTPRPWWRGLARLMAGAVICYLGIIVMLWLLETWVLFRPTTHAQEWWPPDPELRAQDVEFASADGRRIHAWWCPPVNWDRSKGALLYCHGNAGNLSHRGPGLVPWQEMLQVGVLIFDYPGYGKSAGKPSEAGCYAAAQAAYDWLVNVQQVPPERIILYGRSLGGGVAVDLASRQKHAGLVLNGTFTSIPELAQQKFPWLPARWMVRNQFNNLAKIGNCRSPVFIAHGTRDSLIPLSQGEQVYDAAHEPKRFYRLEGLDHNDGPGSDFYVALIQFLAASGTPFPLPATTAAQEK